MNRSDTRRRTSVAVHFRDEIAKAEARGVSRADMKLHLTLNDASQLKRDRSLALTDISFADGVMTYLGVTIVEGGVPVSALSHSGTA